ncbi:MAG: DUF2793 domain-containing protein, partial [Pseudomonadota bacterium]
MTTPNLQLPYIAAAQAQKHVTHNEAIRALDAIVQIGVLGRRELTPPDTPSEGDRYIVSDGATGSWSAHEGEVAAWQDGAWAFYKPAVGWIAWVADEKTLTVWDGVTWAVAGASSGGTSPSVNPAPYVGVNTTADDANRLSVKSDAVLHTHDDVTPGSGDVRHTLNKAATTGTASLVFQTGYSGRAEFGTTGDDDWHVKVSPDGATWHEAIVVGKDTGWIGVG